MNHTKNGEYTDVVKKHGESVFVGYNDVITAFGKEKLEDRYEALLTTADIFIKEMGYAERVHADRISFLYTMLDYFSDILRLKNFHNISLVNEEKITAYEVFWLLKRKPLQVLKSDKELVYVNERFAISRIIHCLEGNKRSILDFEKLNFFTETLFYFLKYRQFDAQMIEMILLSFNAGEIYSKELAVQDVILPSGNGLG